MVLDLKAYLQMTSFFTTFYDYSALDQEAIATEKNEAYATNVKKNAKHGCICHQHVEQSLCSPIFQAQLV